jgi:hypothetical protein
VPENPKNYETSTEYELLVKSVYEEILVQEGVDNVEVSHDQKLKGKSRVEHQIDVLWRFRRAGIEHLVIIECKNYGRMVELGDVRSFHSVVEDMVGAKGVMVTRVGFQSGAKAFAEHQGIGLKLLRPPLDEDWEGLIKNADVHITAKSFDRQRQPSVNFLVPGQFAAEVAGATPKGSGVDIQLLDKDGNPKSPPMGRWLSSAVPMLDKPAGGPYIHRIALADTYLRFERPGAGDSLVPIDFADVTYYISESEQTVKISGGDLVKYVLKDFVTRNVEHFQRRVP